jgi:hypothetical protein
MRAATCRPTAAGSGAGAGGATSAVEEHWMPGVDLGREAVIARALSGPSWISWFGKTLIRLGRNFLNLAGAPGTTNGRLAAR